MRARRAHVANTLRYLGELPSATGEKSAQDDRAPTNRSWRMQTPSSDRTDAYAELKLVKPGNKASRSLGSPRKLSQCAQRPRAGTSL